MALATGTRLGAYEVVTQIGAGGMGEVYQAHDTKLGRVVDLIRCDLQALRRLIGKDLSCSVRERD